MNISIVIYILLITIGFCTSWLISSHIQSRYRIKQINKHKEMLYEINILKQKINLSNLRNEEYDKLNNNISNLKNINTYLESELRKISIKLESNQLNTENKINQILNDKYHMNEQFENIANRVFEKTNRLVDEQNRQSLSSLLIPLKEQLDIFRRQIQDNFGQEARERHTLIHEINNLKKFNTQIAQEAINLTNALKGNNKTQGNWGELILTRVLESSGLREGHEFETQVSTVNDINNRMQPDVIIHLPQGKDIIIDAKMTLISYERYFNAEDNLTKELALQDHIASIRNHINVLSNKDYQQLHGIQSLDYVLMFISIEPAFLLALNKQPEILTEALRNNIMLVSPTTLMVALRTISNLWRYEQQSRNAQKIADKASKLYDKIRLFVDDMSLIGQNLDRTQNSYRQAMKKIVSGRGNLIIQTEAFRSLGVSIKREINSKLTEEAKDQDNNIEDEYYSHKEDNNTISSLNTNVFTM